MPAIEFAMNSARSESTGFSPFFLNYGISPGPMVWSSNTEYPGVRSFARKMKQGLMSAHDAILAARVKQVRVANNHRRRAPFEEGDFVYLSTKNLSIPKGMARKLVPKFIGPFKIIKDYGNDSFRLDLSAEMRARRIHPTFHASLLRPHVPNDDRRFPGRNFEQVLLPQPVEKEWEVNKVLGHSGKGKDAMFKLLWTSGDESWMAYHEIKHLEPLREYFEAQGVDRVEKLPLGNAVAPDDPQIHLACIARNERALRSYCHRIARVYVELVDHRLKQSLGSASLHGGDDELRSQCMSMSSPLLAFKTPERWRANQ